MHILFNAGLRATHGLVRCNSGWDVFLAGGLPVMAAFAAATLLHSRRMLLSESTRNGCVASLQKVRDITRMLSCLPRLTSGP
jgi:hypothetical protein